MRRLTVTFSTIFILISGFLSAQEPVKVVERYPISVLPIEDSIESSMEFNRIIAEDFLVEQIVKIPIYKVLERSKLKSIIQEQELQMSGAVINETIVKIGELTGARFLLQPTIIKLENVIEGTTGNDTFSSNLINATVSIRIFDVESGEVVFASTGKGRSRAPQEASASIISCINSAFNMCIYDLVEYVNNTYSLDLVNFGMRLKKKNPTTAVFLSFIPGAGQFYAENPEGGKETMVMALAAAGSLFLVDDDKSWVKTCGWLIIGTAAYTYIFSFWDAHHSANKYNIEMGLVAYGNSWQEDDYDLYDLKLGIAMKLKF